MYFFYFPTFTRLNTSDPCMVRCYKVRRDSTMDRSSDDKRCAITCFYILRKLQQKLRICQENSFYLKLTPSQHAICTDYVHKSTG